MIERGTVLERRSDGAVVVEVRRSAACDSCHARGACGMGFGVKTAKVIAHDSLGARAGQTVTVEVGDGAFLAACAWVYGVPVAGLLVGALLGVVLAGRAGLEASQDALSALLALIGLGLGGVAVWWRDRRVRDARGAPSGRFRVQVSALSDDGGAQRPSPSTRMQ